MLSRAYFDGVYSQRRDHLHEVAGSVIDAPAFERRAPEAGLSRAGGC